ncbi:unnamed protein product [Spirodela intermedia]|uniref:Tudor domain-containing protein n=1 Tax=Spirodela intermedia TaxID=51605 RepID=A0A7I8LB35_SPIIN|nr:unnamed protein product [Spirodela intermedia]
MADAEKELEEVLLGVGNRILTPPSAVDDLLPLLDDIFRIIVEAFEKLDDMDSRSYSKRVSILETVAKVRSCVVMLDLECDALILEMFGHFLKTIRQADDSMLSERTISDERPKGSGKREPEVNHPKSSASSGAEQQIVKDDSSARPSPMDKKVENSGRASSSGVDVALDQSAKKARGKSSETTGTSQGGVKGREAGGSKSASSNGDRAEATSRGAHGRRSELEDASEKSAVGDSSALIDDKSPDAARPRRGRPPGSKSLKNKVKTSAAASVPQSGPQPSSAKSIRSKKQIEGPKRESEADLTGESEGKQRLGRVGRKRAADKPGEGEISERRRGSKTKQQRDSKGEDSEAGAETPKAGSRKKQQRIRENEEEEQQGYDGAIVGAKIKVWWPDDRKFYRGVIDSYDPASMKHKVLYVDGDEEDLLLKNEVFRFLKDGGPAKGPHPPLALERDGDSLWEKKGLVSSTLEETSAGKGALEAAPPSLLMLSTWIETRQEMGSRVM